MSKSVKSLKTDKPWPPVCRRGDIFFANLNPVIGSEQGGVRPVLIVQNDRGNRTSGTTIVAALTSQRLKRRLPTHVWLPAARYGLERDSTVLVEQIRTIDKRRLKNRIARLDADGMAQLEAALRAGFGLPAVDDGRAAVGWKDIG